MFKFEMSSRSIWTSSFLAFVRTENLHSTIFNYFSVVKVAMEFMKKLSAVSVREIQAGGFAH